MLKSRGFLHGRVVLHEIVPSLRNYCNLGMSLLLSNLLVSQNSWSCCTNTEWHPLVLHHENPDENSLEQESVLVPLESEGMLRLAHHCFKVNMPILSYFFLWGNCCGEGIVKFCQCLPYER